MAQHNPSSPISRQIERLRHMRHLLASEDHFNPSTRAGFRKLQKNLAVRAAAAKERNAQLLQAIEDAQQQDSQQAVATNMQLYALRAAYMALLSRTLPSWHAAMADQLEQDRRHLHNSSCSPQAARAVQPSQQQQQQLQQCTLSRGGPWDLQHRTMLQHGFEKPPELSHVSVCDHGLNTAVQAYQTAGAAGTPPLLEQLTQTLAEQSCLLQQLLQQQQQQQQQNAVSGAPSVTARSVSFVHGTAASGLRSNDDLMFHQHQQLGHEAEQRHSTVFGHSLFASRKTQLQQQACGAAGHSSFTGPQASSQQAQEQQGGMQYCRTVSQQACAAQHLELMPQQRGQPSLRTIQEREHDQSVQRELKHQEQEQQQQQQPQQPQHISGEVLMNSTTVSQLPGQQQQQELGRSYPDVANSSISNAAVKYWPVGMAGPASAAEHQQLGLRSAKPVCAQAQQTENESFTEEHHHREQQQQQYGLQSNVDPGATLLAEQAAAHPIQQLCGSFSSSSSIGSGTNTVASKLPSQGAAGVPADAAAAVANAQMLESTSQQLDSRESSNASTPSALSPSQLQQHPPPELSHSKGNNPVQVAKTSMSQDMPDTHSAPSHAVGTDDGLELGQVTVQTAAMCIEPHGSGITEGTAAAAAAVKHTVAPLPTPALPAAAAGSPTTAAAHAGVAPCRGQRRRKPQQPAGSVSEEHCPAAVSVNSTSARVGQLHVLSHLLSTHDARPEDEMLDGTAPTGGSSSSTAMSSQSGTPNRPNSGSKLGLSALTVGLGTRSAAATCNSAAWMDGSRGSSEKSLGVTAPVSRTSSSGGAAAATAGCSVGCHVASGCTAALGPLSTGQALLFSPATRLSLGAVGHSMTSPHGRPSLSSESEPEAGGRCSIGAASTGSAPAAAVTRLAAPLHIPADAVVPGTMGAGAPAPGLSRSGSGADANAAQVGVRISVAGTVGQQQQQQQVVTQGPLTANAPKLPLALGKLCSMRRQQQSQQSPASNDDQEPSLQQEQPLQQPPQGLMTNGRSMTISTQEQLTSGLTPPSAVPVDMQRNSSLHKAQVPGSTAGNTYTVLTVPSQAQLMSKVLNSGLTDFRGSDSEGDEDFGMLTAGHALGSSGKGAASFEPDEFD